MGGKHGTHLMMRDLVEEVISLNTSAETQLSLWNCCTKAAQLKLNMIE